MSTRCNVVVTFGDTKIYLYRHCDGYPSGVGRDLVPFLLDFMRNARVDCRRAPTTLLEQLIAVDSEAGLELTTGFHMDIEYAYWIRVSEIHDRVDVAMREIPSARHRGELAPGKYMTVDKFEELCAKDES